MPDLADPRAYDAVVALSPCRMRAAILLSLVALVAGCSGGKDPTASDASDVCRGGDASPVQAMDVVAALEARGFDMALEERSPTCEIESVVAYMTNSPGTSGLSENAKQLGHVICDVEEQPASARSGLRERADDDKIIFYANNVRCTLYTRREDGGKGIPLLRQAMREFAAR